MKLLIVSDLHTEFAPYAPPPGVSPEAVVLAGDIGVGAGVIDWIGACFGTAMPVVYVPGNHEFYGGELHQVLAGLRHAARGTPNVHLLDGNSVVLGGVRFVGSTLWTDFALPTRRGDRLVSDPMQSIVQSSRALNDYHAAIALDTPGGARLLEPADTLALHRSARAWLETTLAEPFAGPTVVVTHHAPHAGSVAARWAADPVSAGFASQLPEPFFAVPTLWVHGHTHERLDYQVGDCRVVCNPRGYPAAGGGFEVAGFDAGLVVEVWERT